MQRNPELRALSGEVAALVRDGGRFVRTQAGTAALILAGLLAVVLVYALIAAAVLVSLWASGIR